jgi:zinc transport system substrate-binding protein
MKNRIVSVLLALIFICLSLCSCSNSVKKDDGKLTVICTIFAPYDFARHVVGDKADVVMLLPPGVESHSYEPTPADIIKIENANVLFYVSENTETWITGITDAVKNPDVSIVDIASGLGVKIHDDEHGEAKSEHGEDELGAGEVDEHIWTSLSISKQMVGFIADKMSEIDSQNKSYYQSNAEEYIAQISQLDSDFKELFKTSKRDEIVSGSRFAMRNFVNEYGLKFIAAFDSCVDNTEPSAAVMAKIIDTINNDKIPVIFYEELTEPKIARAVSHETGAKMLLLHSCHNVSSDELKAGATYVSLMRQNYYNLKEALN